jgi:hypothetical protein
MPKTNSFQIWSKIVQRVSSYKYYIYITFGKLCDKDIKLVKTKITLKLKQNLVKH